MFTKILIANRGDDEREALGAAKPNRVVREAHPGDFTAENKHV
ncbi:hypothetical protein [Scleromatobacter humisilvae]|nr:hypothetical protein [Scleromatobacter humisilvae]